MFGSDESHNVVLARLENLNEALAAAESSRILKEAIYRVASSGDAELISGLSGNAGPGAPAGAMANSLGLIQNLRAQEASIKAELDQDRVKYGSAYPRISEAQAELSGIQQSIHDEVRRIGERAHTDYQIAVKAEASAQSEFEKQKKLANALNDKAIAYGLAKQEADSSRDVYEGLLAKLKQAGVLEGLRSTNITVVNPASVPPPNRPKSPNLLLYYTVAIAMGFGLGGILAVVRDLTDAKISSLEDIERAIGAPLMGLIPEIKSRSRSSYLRQVIRISKSVQMIAGEHKSRIATSTYIDSPFTESLRSLRTSLMLSRSGGPPQVLLLTSSTASEGKSTISLNLATVLTQQGARVLLVDADLRRPVLHQRIGVTCTEHGISAVLTSDQNDFLPQQVGGVPNLFVFCGGTPPPFPAELLGSLKMQMLLAQWRQEYDFIVLDGPPLLPVTDAVVFVAAMRCGADGGAPRLYREKSAAKKLSNSLPATARACCARYSSECRAEQVFRLL
jgi:capsular exopolysaccharide synthesis family protein